MPVDVLYTNTLDEVIKYVLQIQKTNKSNQLYFRGENKDFGDTAMTPSIYRNNNLQKEHKFYREMQRFNEQEFIIDKTAFDKLSRMQHYLTPTRMIDISEDLLSACFFSLDKREKYTESVIYIIEVDTEKIKYYDSDTVSVVANLVKSPLYNPDNPKKSKSSIWSDAREYIGDKCGYNSQDLKSKHYLIHDIKEEKPYFQDIIDPQHIFSVFCVKPKFTNQRIHGQKGAFLLFGLNRDDCNSPIALFSQSNGQLYLNEKHPLHPIRKVTKIILDPHVKIEDLEQLGISLPYIYPELEKVSEYLKYSKNL